MPRTLIKCMIFIGFSATALNKWQKLTYFSEYEEFCKYIYFLNLIKNALFGGSTALCLPKLSSNEVNRA